MLRPVGDLPARVYWVRRLVVAGGLLLVVALVWWLWPAGGDAAPSEDAGSPTPTPSPSVSVSSSSPSPTDPATTKQPTGKPTKSACEDSAIEVTVTTDAQSYSSGEQPAISFSVENVSDRACSRDIGQAANELQITSGGERVWSSDDCNPGGAEDIDDLRPGQGFDQTVTWPRIESAEGCPTPQQAAPPGTYQVIARNGDVLSEPAVFVLE